MKETTLGKTSGSIYDCSEECGITSIPNDEITAQLKALSTPKFKLSNGLIDNNKLNISTNLEALEVKLIEIKLK